MVWYHVTVYFHTESEIFITSFCDLFSCSFSVLADTVISCCRVNKAHYISLLNSHTTRSAFTGTGYRQVICATRKSNTQVANTTFVKFVSFPIDFLSPEWNSAQYNHPPTPPRWVILCCQQERSGF